MTLAEFLKLTTEELKKIRSKPWHGEEFSRPHIKCADGYLISVQASEYNYCDPKALVEEYQEVEAFEIDDTKEREEAFLPYLEWDDPNAVYCYVPVEVVQEVIDKHGGISELIITPHQKEWGTVWP